MDKPIDDAEPELRPARSQVRNIVAMLVIGTATAQAAGVAMRAATQFEANDISRWCTVWSLVEKGTYSIDACPWQVNTQDKVKKPDKLPVPQRTDSVLKHWEYELAPRSWKKGDPVERFYSSKPPLLPTMIAGVLYPIRKITGVPLDKERLQPREERNVQKVDPNDPTKFEYVKETPKDPVHWPVYVYYFKPITIFLNIVPMLIFLVLFARLLDRFAANDWAWMASLFAAAFGTYLLAFHQTLNNHTIAAYSAFFAIYAAIKIWDEPESSTWRYAVCGFFAAFTACNELPAATFGILVFLMVFFKSPAKTILGFIPAAMVPIAAFLVTQYIAMGQFTPVYEEFGTKAYTYEGSAWNTPLEFDYFNKVPESKQIYLLHMLIGHHGVFSLTPIFLFSLLGIFRSFRAGSKGLTWIAAISLILTIAMIAFYDWNPKARNYGGSTQGLRWLFWLIPFWLITLPAGLEPGGNRRWFRNLSLLALMASAFSVGYAMRNPWSHPWILDALERLGYYPLKR